MATGTKMPHATSKMLNRVPNLSREAAEAAEEQDEADERAEKIILAIEKFSVFIFLFSFLGFNIFYWIDIVSLKGDLSGQFNE